MSCCSPRSAHQTRPLPCYLTVSTQAPASCSSPFSRVRQRRRRRRDTSPARPPALSPALPPSLPSHPPSRSLIPSAPLHYDQSMPPIPSLTSQTLGWSKASSKIALLEQGVGVSSTMRCRGFEAPDPKLLRSFQSPAIKVSWPTKNATPMCISASVPLSNCMLCTIRGALIDNVQTICVLKLLVFQASGFFPFPFPIILLYCEGGSFQS